MSVELKVPESGESISEVRIGSWLKAEGDRVEKDEPVVELETDKASMELPAPEAGVLAEILKAEGEDAEVGEVIGRIETEKAEAEEPGDAQEEESEEPEPDEKEEAAGKRDEEAEPDEQEETETAEEEAEEEERAEETEETKEELREGKEPEEMDEDERSRIEERLRVTPSARRALEEHGIEASEVHGSGPGGRVLKKDVLRHAEGQAQESGPGKRPLPEGGTAATREEESVPMSSIRRRIAERLVQAQQEAALLTTFNEIDLSEVIGLRKSQGERFLEAHGVKLGFMSFFVRAVVEALDEFPELNARIEDDKIVYRNYQDIGIAVGGGKGLVVPVLRNAHAMSFAEIEERIADLAERAKANDLDLEELQGGTFTISNGGIYGSLLSTPIVNPPQSGILGMHAIQERPVARDGEIVLRPMMYVALTYDHRIVDGREAVGFLKRVKDTIETPARILLEI